MPHGEHVAEYNLLGAQLVHFVEQYLRGKNKERFTITTIGTHQMNIAPHPSERTSTKHASTHPSGEPA